MKEVRLSASQRRMLDWQKENLVTAAEALLSEGNVVGISKKKLGDSQLRNLMAIAGETESPAVVVNYIRYQMGRDTKREHWGKIFKHKAFGDLLVEAIEKGAVEQAVEAVEEHQEARLEKPLRQIARMQMLRYFLGFMSRHLKYLRIGGEQ